MHRNEEIWLAQRLASNSETDSFCLIGRGFRDGFEALRHYRMLQVVLIRPFGQKRISRNCNAVEASGTSSCRGLSVTERESVTGVVLEGSGEHG